MAGALSSGIATLFSAKLYKPSLGKIARRSTFFGLTLLFLAAGWVTYHENLYKDLSVSAVVGGILFLIGCWVSFRAVNLPSFAEFLISVEAEMRKVSWPGKKELFQTTKVVLVMMVLFVVLIFCYDVIFKMLFGMLDKVIKAIGIG